MLDTREVVGKIKKAGAGNVRAVPMPGQSAIDGLYLIEARMANGWESIIQGLPLSTAQDLIKQATSRVILG